MEEEGKLGKVMCSAIGIHFCNDPQMCTMYLFQKLSQQEIPQ